MPGRDDEFTAYVTAGTVKSRTARGLDALRRALRPVQSLTDGETPA